MLLKSYWQKIEYPFVLISGFLSTVSKSKTFGVENLKGRKQDWDTHRAPDFEDCSESLRIMQSFDM